MRNGLLYLRQFSRATVLTMLLIYSRIPCCILMQVPMSNFESSSENTLNDDKNFTLEDTFQNFISSNLYCDYVMCKDDYEKAEYPYKKILDVLNLHAVESQYPSYQFSFTSETALIPRMGSLPPFVIDTTKFNRPATPGCKEIYRRLFPIKGKGIDGRDYYIVNVRGFQQSTDIITCHKSGSTCGDKSMIPEKYVFRCKQKHADVKLSTFPVNENITADAQSIHTFKIPNGCSCEEFQVHGDL